MSPTTARVLRVATFVAFGLVLVAGSAFVYRILSADPPAKTAEPRSGELSVTRAIDIAGREPLAVRGYVFAGPGGLGLRLCNGVQATSPPRCLGPYLDLERVNEGSFDLAEAETDDGPMLHPKGRAVTLRGTILGTVMDVEQILQ